jgi:hypothetical protein
MLLRMAEASTAELIAEEARHALIVQEGRFDALDSKAGVMLGFSAALSALAPVGVHLLVEVGRVVAVAGGVAALWASWPHRFASIDLRPLREEYLAAEHEFLRRRLLETRIALTERQAVTLRRKAIGVRTSMLLLSVATALTAAGLGTTLIP